MDILVEVVKDGWLLYSICKEIYQYFKRKRHKPQRKRHKRKSKRR